LPLPLVNETFEGPGSALDYVFAKNITRRHINETQRAMIAAKIANCSEGRPANTAQIQAVSQEEEARKLDVSRSSVQSATRVIDHGIPALVTAVDSGQIKVSKGAAIAKKEPTEQATLLAKALGPKPRSKPHTHRNPKNLGASVTDTAGGVASPDEGASTPVDPCDQTGPPDDEPGRHQTPDEEIELKVDTSPAAAKSSPKFQTIFRCKSLFHQQLTSISTRKCSH
jgi:hypothetical protein